MPRPAFCPSSPRRHSTGDALTEASKFVAEPILVDQLGQSVLVAEAMVVDLLDQLRQAHMDLGDKIALLCKENSSLQPAMRNGAGHFCKEHAPGGDVGRDAAVLTSDEAPITRDATSSPCGSTEDVDDDIVCVRSGRRTHSVLSLASQDDVPQKSWGEVRQNISKIPINPIWQTRHDVGIIKSIVKQAPCDTEEMANMHALPEVEETTGCWRRLISFPGSPFRFAWDVIGFVFILYDLIMIPLRLFSPPETVATEVIDWTLLLYWTSNVFMSLLVGYVYKGITIMVPKKILKNYLRTWFIVDVMVLLPDWYITISAFVSGSSNAAKGAGSAVKLLRIMRLTKCLRLLRAAKLKKMIQQITDQIDSEYTGICLNIIKMIILLLIINHYVASFWYVVGSLDKEKTWVKEYGYDDVDWYAKYAMSFHWGITQFTPASKVPLQPQNLVERAYAIFVVIFALVGFSYIVGSITGSLSQLRAIAEDADKQFYQVRRYLRQNEIPNALGTRIVRYLEHAYWKSRHRTRGEKIQIFGLLSENLRSQLQLECALPCLKVHPLFDKLSEKCLPTLQRITNEISSKSLAVGEVLFFCGDEAMHVYFLENGRVAYQCGTGHSCKMVQRREAWITEQVLWTVSWHHTGYAASIVETEVLLLSPAGFSKTVSMAPAAFSVVSSYAQRFVKWLSSGSHVAQQDLILCEEYETVLGELLPGGQMARRKTKTLARRVISFGA